MIDFIKIPIKYTGVHLNQFYFGIELVQQFINLIKHKNGYTSVNLTDTELKFDVIVAQTDPHHVD